MKRILEKYSLLNIHEEISRIQNEIIPFTKINNVEVATGINLKTGLEDLERLHGEKTKVGIIKHLTKIQGTSLEYVHIHTHPDNSPPSPEDIIFFLQTIEIKYMVIFGISNVTYFMSKRNNLNISEEEVKRKLEHYSNNLSEDYTKKYKETGNIEHIENLLEHVWNVTCKQFGIDYHVIKGG